MVEGSGLHGENVTVSEKTGNRRLLKLADILDVADAEHRKRKEPTYDQREFTHMCGTPACALAHWADANPRRWSFYDVSPVLRNVDHGDSAFFFGQPIMDSACADFAISDDESAELFGGSGCGDARTAKQAAKYIRRFVARRIKRGKGNG